jgi:hypothetical protein
MDPGKIREILDRTDFPGRPLDLDVLLFLQRHPDCMLASDQLAAYVGYEAQDMGPALERLIRHGAVLRSQSPTQAARMYRFAPGGVPHDELRALLAFAATADGRRSVMRVIREPLPAGGTAPSGADRPPGGRVGPSAERLEVVRGRTRPR